MLSPHMPSAAEVGGLTGYGDALQPVMCKGIPLIHPAHVLICAETTLQKVKPESVRWVLLLIGRGLLRACML